jgi:hypothetical protein
MSPQSPLGDFLAREPARTNPLTRLLHVVSVIAEGAPLTTERPIPNMPGLKGEQTG